MAVLPTLLTNPIDGGTQASIWGVVLHGWDVRGWRLRGPARAVSERQSLVVHYVPVVLVQPVVLA